MIEYKKLQKTLERIANWTPLTSYPGLYDDLDIARLNLKHIQRYAKDALEPPSDRNELVTAFQEFCRQRKITAHDPTHQDYVLCVQSDGSGRVTGPSLSQHLYFRSLDHGVEVLKENVKEVSTIPKLRRAE